MSLLAYPAAVNVEASVLRVDDGASKDTVREKKTGFFSLVDLEHSHLQFRDNNVIYSRGCWSSKF